MTKIIFALIAIFSITACSNLPKAEVNIPNVERPLPANLNTLCEEYDKYLTSDIQSVIVTHTNNMEKAIICKEKHNKLVEILKERKI